MRKLNYKTKYMQDCVSALMVFKCSLIQNEADMTVTGDKEVINDVIKKLKALNLPLTFQTEGAGNILVLFDPRL